MKTAESSHAGRFVEGLLGQGAKRLRDTAKRPGEEVVAQRLGYLLDRVGRRSLTKGLAER